jgi:anti-anti-sigma regulatory factor
MNIRIDKETEGNEIVLHVSGRLADGAIAQLTNVCESINDHYVLDLSMLMFADDAGAEAIRTLREGGANIRGASSFIELLISDETA